MYQFDLDNGTCKTCKSGQLDKVNIGNLTSGWCPKVKQNYPVQDFQDMKYWCSEGSGELINFPFKLEGEVLNEPFTDNDNLKKAITKNQNKTNLEDDFSMNELEEVVECHGNFY